MWRKHSCLPGRDSELLKSPRQIWRPGKLSWAATLLCGSQSWLQAGFPARPAA